MQFTTEIGKGKVKKRGSLYFKMISQRIFHFCNKSEGKIANLFRILELSIVLI